MGHNCCRQGGFIFENPSLSADVIQELIDAIGGQDGAS